MPVKVAVLDDHPIVRDALCSIISQQPEFEVVASGSTAGDLLEVVDSSDPHVVVVDLKMPGSTLDAIRSVTGGQGSRNILVFTASAETTDCLDAIEAGALGYVVKGSSSDELFRALRSVSEGREYLSPGIAGRCLKTITERSRQKAEQPSYDLSYREAQIVEQLLNGASNKSIARTLSISEKTVKYYMTQIMQKLNAKNRVEVALTVQRDRAATAGIR
jgi:two-component system nitrate/nitrite response regulator NarL